MLRRTGYEAMHIPKFARNNINLVSSCSLTNNFTISPNAGDGPIWV